MEPDQRRAGPDDGDAERFRPAPGRRRRRGPVLLAVAAGGAVGALARHGVDLLLPVEPATFPLGTFAVNVAGCLLLGVLAGALYQPDRHRLVLPFVVTGVLGGFTTFSTYTVQTVDLG
ncbi:MAG: CrcB family protein, partial [Geodermatophilaceae bacterium]|nr:CrcB family protein [Geodermatophilaceae bacterium]